MNTIIILRGEFLLHIKYVHGFVTVEYYSCRYTSIDVCRHQMKSDIETVHGNHIPDVV